MSSIRMEQHFSRQAFESTRKDSVHQFSLSSEYRFQKFVDEFVDIECIEYDCCIRSCCMDLSNLADLENCSICVEREPIFYSAKSDVSCFIYAASASKSRLSKFAESACVCLRSSYFEPIPPDIHPVLLSYRSLHSSSK